MYRIIVYKWTPIASTTIVLYVMIYSISMNTKWSLSFKYVH